MSQRSPLLTAGDTAPRLDVEVNANLTGANAVAHIKRPDRTILTRTVVIDDAALGKGHVVWQNGDLTQPGQHTVEVQVTYSDSTVQTFATPNGRDNTSFRLRAQYA